MATTLIGDAEPAVGIFKFCIIQADHRSMPAYIGQLPRTASFGHPRECINTRRNSLAPYHVLTDCIWQCIGCWKWYLGLECELACQGNDAGVFLDQIRRLATEGR